MDRLMESAQSTDAKVQIMVDRLANLANDIPDKTKYQNQALQIMADSANKGYFGKKRETQLAILKKIKDELRKRNLF
jgi:hypothetical protein